MATLEKLVDDVDDFLTNTEDSRILSERDRDYKDHKQWTAEEKSKIEARGQAAIVRNRVKPKVEGLKGLLIQRKTDPKAYPRTPKHEKAAEVVTDGLRYVADNTSFDKVKLDVAENVFVEGYSGAIVQYEGDEITVTHIPWDRYYYDIHSRRLDFADKRWDGIVIWMDIEQIPENFGITALEAETLLSDDGQETFDDKPQWVDKKQRRVRVCQHFFFEKYVWKMCYFTSERFLIDPIPSPYLDEEGRPTNPIETVSANIDRDNNRFGEVRFWIDLQDVVNHSASKFVHTMNQRQTMGRKGAISDIPGLKRELAKPDGHVEYEGEKGDFEVIQTQDMAEAQFRMYQDAKSELDAVGFNAQLSGERQGNLSGSAITNLQNAATNELSSLYENLNDWEKRIYRQIWMRMKNRWTQEKWMRVTDDSSKMRWVGLNQPIVLAQLLEEQSQDESLPLQAQIKAGQTLQMMQQNQDPRLNQIVEVRNDVTELDLDIIIETSYDTINVQREQFDLLSKIAQTRPDVPFTEVLKLSELRGKDKIIKSLEASAQANGQAAQEQAKLDSAEKQSKSQLNAAKAQKEVAAASKAGAEADQIAYQTDLMETQPPDNSGIVI